MNIALEQTEEYVNGQVCNWRAVAVLAYACMCMYAWLDVSRFVFAVEKQVRRCFYQRQ